MSKIFGAEKIRLRYFNVIRSSFYWNRVESKKLWLKVRANVGESEAFGQFLDKSFSFSSLAEPSSKNLQSLTENSPTSAGIESEYDTASTNSRSDNEQDEYEDDEEDSLDDEATGKAQLLLHSDVRNDINAHALF